MEHLGKQEREEELHFEWYLIFCHICFVGEEEDFSLGLFNDPGDEEGAAIRKIYLLALNIMQGEFLLVLSFFLYFPFRPLWNGPGQVLEIYVEPFLWCYRWIYVFVRISQCQCRTKKKSSFFIIFGQYKFACKYCVRQRFSSLLPRAHSLRSVSATPKYLTPQFLSKTIFTPTNVWPATVFLPPKLVDPQNVWPPEKPWSQHFLDPHYFWPPKTLVPNFVDPQFFTFFIFSGHYKCACNIA